MDINDLRGTVEQWGEARGIFIVDIAVSRDDDVTVTIEKNVGSVELDDCAALRALFAR